MLLPVRKHGRLPGQPRAVPDRVLGRGARYPGHIAVVAGETGDLLGSPRASAQDSLRAESVAALSVRDDLKRVSKVDGGHGVPLAPVPMQHVRRGGVIPADPDVGGRHCRDVRSGVIQHRMGHLHRVFCGINDDLMAFREKSVDRVIDEMIWLSHRYRTVKLTAADWIVSKRSRDELFRRLKQLDFDVECFYETRADMKKDELALMRDAGVVSVQPGIESMSTDLLKLMKKSTTRIRHVQFLRWCREYDVHLAYNLLAGFPGERPEWYHDMAAFLPKIVHLQPPLYNAHFVEMHRFSPLHERRELFGVQDYRIREDYAFNFPLGEADLNKVGYFFDYASSTLADRDDYIEELRAAIAPWIERHQDPEPPQYAYRIGPGFIQVTDTRFGDGRVLKLGPVAGRSGQSAPNPCRAARTPGRCGR